MGCAWVLAEASRWYTGHGTAQHSALRPWWNGCWTNCFAVGPDAATSTVAAGWADIASDTPSWQLLHHPTMQKHHSHSGTTFAGPQHIHAGMDNPRLRSGAPQTLPAATHGGLVLIEDDVVGEASVVHPAHALASLHTHDAAMSIWSRHEGPRAGHIGQPGQRSCSP